MRRAGPALAAAALCCAMIAQVARAQAPQSLTLRASLKPERLGQQTTIGFDFAITAAGGRVPSPLTAVTLRYPGDVGLVVSGLGLDACTPRTLQLRGGAGCPSDAHMGSGSATVEIPLGGAVLRESAQVTIVRAETRDERFGLTFYLEGASPIVARLALPALLLSARAPFGGSVAIESPLVASVPEAPDLSVVRLAAAIGPEHLTYYRRERGRSVAYRPRGVRLPNSCPRGGFPFTAAVSFLDGSHAAALATVPCPGPASTRRRGG